MGEVRRGWRGRVAALRGGGEGWDGWRVVLRREKGVTTVL